MAIFNLQDRTINAKIVYTGPALGGKTTSLKAVHAVLDPEQKIELISLNTEADRTLFFDFLPISLGSIGGFSVKLQAFTVPGQVKYNLTRKYVLTGADAVIFVVDSTQEKLESDLRSFENLDENLLANGINPNELPIVLQYNKRDLTGTVPIEELEERFNRRGITSFSTVAINGEGTFEAFTELAVETLDRLARTHLGGRKSHGLAHALRERLQDQFRLVHPDRSLQSAVRLKPLSAASESPVGPDGESIELLRERIAERDRRIEANARDLAALGAAARALATSPDPGRALLDAATSGCASEHGSIVYPVRGGGWAERRTRGFPEDPLVQIDRAEPCLIGLTRGGEPFLLARDSHPDLLARLREEETSLRGAVGVPIAGGRFGTGAYLVVYAVGGGEALRAREAFLAALGAQAILVGDSSADDAPSQPLPLSALDDLDVARAVDPAELAAAREEAAAWQRRARIGDETLAEIGTALARPLAEIRERLAGSDPTEREIETIDADLAGLERRMRNLADLIAIQAGNVKWQPEPVAVRPLLREVFEAHKRQILERSIRVKIRQGERPPVALADPRWLARALGGLIANAVRWSPPGGLVELVFEERGERLVVSVRDEGPGIPSVARPRLTVFPKEAFRLPSGTELSRTGLGLPLAAAIVAAHGGELRLGGGPGEGTIAALDLPRAITASAEGGSPEASPTEEWSDRAARPAHPSA